MNKYSIDPRSIKILNNYSIIEDIELDNSILIIPKSSNCKDFIRYGKIVNSSFYLKDGEGKELYDLPFKEGDLVIYDYRSYQCQFYWDNKTYYMIRSEDIYCVLS